MKIQQIKLTNIKGITEIDFQVLGKHLLVRGGNAKNKSSLIDGVFLSLMGEPAPAMLNKAAQSGQAEIDLGEFKVDLRFTEKSKTGTLYIRDPEGKVMATPGGPRTWLNEKVGIIDIPLDSFFSKSEKEQEQFLYRLLNVDVSEEDAEYKLLFADRTGINRNVDTLKKQVAGLPVVDENLQYQDISQLQMDYQNAMQFNQTISRVKETQASMHSYIQKREQRIAELEQEIAAEKQHIQELQDKVNVGNVWLSNNDEKPLTEMSAAIQTAIDNNSKHQQIAEVKLKKQQYAEALEEQYVINNRMKGILIKKQEKIRNSPVKIDGLTIDEDGPKYQGLPFHKSQQNTAEQIIFMFLLVLNGIKDIEVARVDISLLDNVNRRRLLDLADMYGIQLFMEEVDIQGGDIQLQLIENNYGGE